MYEIILRLNPAPLIDEAVVRPLVEEIGQVPGFVPRAYDLNQRDQWKPFDLDRAVVDALTQRTQLLRLRGEDPSVLAMVATGKHGEQPTAIVRSPCSQVELDGWRAQWRRLFERLPLESITVSSPAWRQALAEAGVAPSTIAALPGLAVGWAHRSVPAGLGRLEGDGRLGRTVVVDREANHVVLHLPDVAQLADGAPSDALEWVTRLVG